jgi:hypothetical protein
VSGEYHLRDTLRSAARLGLGWDAVIAASYLRLLDRLATTHGGDSQVAAAIEEAAHALDAGIARRSRETDRWRQSIEAGADPGELGEPGEPEEPADAEVIAFPGHRRQP